MDDETDPLGGWGRLSAGHDGVAPVVAARPRPRRQWLLAAVAVMAVASAAAIVTEVAGVAPRSRAGPAAVGGATSARALGRGSTTAPASSPVSTFPPPAGEWMSRGTVVAQQRTGRQPGSTLIRAWWFDWVCGPASGCHTEFVRQLADGTTDEARLVPGSIYRGGPVRRRLAARGSSRSAPYFTASFPPTMSTCLYSAGPGKPTRVKST